MIHLLLIVFFIFCASVVGGWLVENPGHVTMLWFDTRIDTSVAFLLFSLLMCAAILAFLTIAIRGVVFAPSRWAKNRQLRHYRLGLSEITYSVAALAANDSQAAALHTRKAQKHLGNTPLTLLLSAQIARSRGDDAQTRLLLDQMLAHKETEFLAARFLSDTASKQQLFPKALSFAQRAYAVNPKEKAAIVAVISLQLRLQHWPEAHAAIDRAARKRQLTRADARRFRGLVQLSSGEAALANKNVDTALILAIDALKKLPAFAPAVVLAANAYAAKDRTNKAIKLLLSVWKSNPHPSLAITLARITALEPKEQRLARLRKLTELQPQQPEGFLAYAQAATEAKDWPTARKATRAALAIAKTAPACKLMADIERGEYADYDAAGRWMARSAEASAEPQWQCTACGHLTLLWHVHCPSCGAFDTLEWKQADIAFITAASMPDRPHFPG